MNDAGKGSTPRPFSVSQEEYSARWDLIFNKRIGKETNKFEKDVLKNEYYDILTTEDCLIEDKSED